MKARIVFNEDEWNVVFLESLEGGKVRSVDIYKVEDVEVVGDDWKVSGKELLRLMKKLLFQDNKVPFVCK